MEIAVPRAVNFAPSAPALPTVLHVSQAIAPSSQQELTVSPAMRVVRLATPTMFVLNVLGTIDL